MARELLDELRASIFSGILRSDHSCEDCGCDCETPMALLGNGRTMRHPDPPSPVVIWSRCPVEMANTLWQIHDDLGGQLTPAEYMSWCYERGVQRLGVPSGMAVLLREYLRIRDLPARLAEVRAVDDARSRSGTK